LAEGFSFEAAARMMNVRNSLRRFFKELDLPIAFREFATKRIITIIL